MIDPIAVRNPRTGEDDFTICPPTADELAALCTRLRAAHPQWAAAPLEHRAEVMLRWADELERGYGRVASADAVDTGHCTISRVGPGVIISSIRAWCQDAARILDGAARCGTLSAMPTVSYETQLVPYQLAGIISPWNAPTMLSLLDAVPALLAGCAVVIKPSEVAPRFSEPVMDTVAAVPELAQVLSYVLGGPETGQGLIDNADVVCFTGSVPTGRKVAQACAGQLKPVYLELGGKDAAIVTASADLEQAATAILRGAVFGTGQVCFSIERIYVHADVHDEFVDTLVRMAEQVTLKYPDPDDGDIGPFGFARQAEIVAAHLADAVGRGATVRTGGAPQSLGGGLYMRPTVLTEVTNDMQIMREETFGPVMPVVAFRTEDEAVVLANDSDYGLSAAVLAGDADEAARIGRRLEAGTISLQDTFLTLFKARDVGSDSFKSSGLGGHRTGPESILRFLRSKALLTNSAPPAPLRQPSAGAGR